MASHAPFRADEVGSLLRPSALKEARAKFAEKKISAADLKQVEDGCIREVVAHQERVGLKAITDGEFRRSWWHFDFLGALEGVELVKGEKTIQFHGIQTRPESLNIHGKVGFGQHPMLEHFKFLKSVTKGVAKMTIPAPSVLHFRGGRAAISKSVYPTLDNFFADTAEAYRKAIHAFHAAGCRYLQFDDTVWAYLCSEKERKAAKERGDDPEPLQRIYAEMINHAVKDKPKDMVVTTHVCRGNFRSSWISEGGYEPVAETLLAKTNYDGYFLEYDTERAGGFEPLRFLPKGNKRVVLGLITSKFGELEAKDAIKKRIDEATKYVALDQLCVSPQCGFASTEEGNILSADEQWKKLERVVEVAKATWGEV